MNINLKYLRREKTGLYSYYRGVPKDLQSQFGGKRFVVESTKTHDPALAGKAAQLLALRDDERWEAMRSLISAGLSPEETQAGAGKLLVMWSGSRGLLHKGGLRDGGNAYAAYMARKYRAPVQPTDEWFDSVAARISPAERTAIDLLDENPATRVYRLSDARDEYLKTHQKQAQIWGVEAITSFAIKILGDLPLKDIRRADGKTLRDAWIANGLRTGTVQRNISSLSAIFNKAKLEFELDLKNPFASIEIENLREDGRDIKPFTLDELAKISAAIIASGVRPVRQQLTASLIAGLQLETGLRLSEAANLRTEDIHIQDEPIPYVMVKAYKELNRAIKNQGSERQVPLVGISLVAAERALAANTGTGWLFNCPPGALSYNSAHQGNKNTSRWLKAALPGDKCSHSFRQH
jgi:integrase